MRMILIITLFIAATVAFAAIFNPAEFEAVQREAGAGVESISPISTKSSPYAVIKTNGEVWIYYVGHGLDGWKITKSQIRKSPVP